MTEHKNPVKIEIEDAKGENEMKIRYTYQFSNGDQLRIFKILANPSAEVDGLVFYSINKGVMHHKYLYRSAGDQFYFIHRKQRIWIHDLKKAGAADGKGGL